jgi:aminoglycoside phosphotransferase (APT) family kinase protein
MGVAHGDFAPWNLLETASGCWGVIDWENCRQSADPYFDLFHYLVQSSSELRRPRKQAILDGLELPAGPVPQSGRTLPDPGLTWPRAGCFLPVTWK